MPPSFFVCVLLLSYFHLFVMPLVKGCYLIYFVLSQIIGLISSESEQIIALIYLWITCG
jgi:hypothetical protein